MARRSSSGAPSYESAVTAGDIARVFRRGVLLALVTAIAAGAAGYYMSSR